MIGIPFAIYKFVCWQFVQQEILFEDKGIRDAFRGSSDRVRGRWWHAVRSLGFFWLLSVAAGPVLGFTLIFTNFSLLWINVIGSVVFALLVPYVALGRTLLYFDLGARGGGRTGETLARAAAAAGGSRRGLSDGQSCVAIRPISDATTPPDIRISVRCRASKRVFISVRSSWRSALASSKPRSVSARSCALNVTRLKLFVFRRCYRWRRPPAKFAHVKLLAFSDLHRDLGQAAELVAMSAEADVVIGAGDFASVHEGLAETIDALARDRGTDRARPRQQRDRAGAARGRERLARRHGPARQRHDDRRGRVLRARRRRPGHPLGVELRPRRRGSRRRCSSPVPRARSSSSTPPRRDTATPPAPAITSAARHCCAAIEAKRPRLAVCGHIHESWGCESRIGETPIRNLGPKGTWIEI